MKKIFVLIVLTLFSYAGSYASFHQLQTKYTHGWLNEVFSDKVKNKNKYEASILFDLYDDAQKKDERWCGSRFNRYKIFIPKEGVKKLRIYTISYPNISYYVLAAFLPYHDPQNINQIDWTSYIPSVSATLQDKIDFFNGKKVFLIRIKNVGELFNLYSSQKYTKSGWLYLQFIQASRLMSSYMGHVDNPSIQLVYKINFESGYEQKLSQWIKNVKFNPSTYDPIDGFDSIIEKNRYCYDFGKVENVPGIREGVYGDLLLQGITTIDTTTPSLEVTTSSSVFTPNSDIVYNIQVKTQSQPLESIGVAVETNDNVTQGVLIKSQIPSCAELVQIEHSDTMLTLFSSDGNVWHQSPISNTKYVGYLLGINNDGIVDANTMIEKTFSLKPSSCGSISTQIKLVYKMGSEIKTINKNIILYRASSTHSTSSSHSTYSTAGSRVPETEEEKRALCESEGGTWVGQCIYSGGTASHSSSSTYYTHYSSASAASSSLPETEEEKRALCESEGGTWVGQCIYSGGTASHSSSSIVSSSDSSISSSQSKKYAVKLDEKTKQIVEAIQQRTMPVQGYFTNYGSGAFDWVYYSENTKRLYKLTGMDQHGYLQWKELTPYFSHIRFEEGNLTMMPKVIRDDEIDFQLRDTIEKIKHQPSFPSFVVKGYFVHYGEGAYDWILFTKGGKLYKLDGKKEDQTFSWINVTKYFKSISLQDYKNITIGDILNSLNDQEISDNSSSLSFIGQTLGSDIEKEKATCERDGGTWVGQCIYMGGDISSKSSSSINSRNSTQAPGTFPGNN